MDWVNKISITCFAASYLVVLGLEVSRTLFNAPYQRIVTIGLTVAGLFAHTVYMAAQGLLDVDANGIWLSNWTAWCFAASWIMAAAYLWVSLRKPESVVGIFLLPVLMALIVAGIVLRDSASFSVNEAKSGWNMIHGFSLMLGTVSVALGFVFGLIYLVQANRLKQKKPQSKLFRLPSLEWLQRCSERSLISSTLLLALGLISGIAINLINQRNGNAVATTIAWSNPVVWSSAILFLWLLLISIFNAIYRPIQQGRKVAYLVVSCFLFLVFELAIVWIAGHAEHQTKTQPETTKSTTTVSFIAQPIQADRIAKEEDR
ncbi:MAG: hypothetical protein AAFN77_13845 [Planctomycetota bacterium]